MADMFDVQSKRGSIWHRWDRIKRFLLEFEFPYLGESYRCQRSDLIRLGHAHKPDLTDDEAARSEGANQFKVNFDQLKQAPKPRPR